MQNDLLISFHCFPHYKGEITIYYKGKMYTEKEWEKIQLRKRRIKEIIKLIIYSIGFVVFVTVRAYVFLEYGI